MPTIGGRAQFGEGRTAHVVIDDADRYQVTRSRAVLLIAWGFLAVGTLAQVLWPDAAHEDSGRQDSGVESAASDTSAEIVGTADGQSGGPAEPLPDDLTFSTDTSPDDPGLSTRTPPIVDDPSQWDQAGVVLAPTSFVATVTGSGVASLAEPEAGPLQHWFPNPTQFGGDRTFLVLDQDSSADYVKVSLPIMPNGQEGWIPRSEVRLSEIDHRALVDLSDATVTVWDGNEVIVDTKAVTGKRETPTPVGVFFVRDIIAQPNPEGGFGPYIVALSGFSEVLETFQGGLPALAIHGTNRPSQIGSRRSNGCVRIPNELITLLADTVPLGTPVTVVA